MKNIFNPIVALLAAVVLATCFTSCLSDDETEYTLYSDCAITSLSLGTVNRYVKTTKKYPDANGVYQDSTYKATYTPKTRFTIDQYKREIYNTDSLLIYTDSTAVLCNFSTKNNGYVYIQSPTSDSIFYHTGTDSVDFTTNPRIFHVMSNDYSTVAKYSLRINIHKEDSLRMTWPTQEAVDAQAVEAFKGLSNGAKVMALGHRIALMGSDGERSLLYSTDDKEENWQPIQPNITLSPLAHDNTAILDGRLYSITDEGVLAWTEDLTNWNLCGLRLQRILGASSKYLYAIGNDGKMVGINPETMATKAETPDETASLLADEQLYSFTLPMNKGMGAETVVLAGLKDGKPTLFAKTEELEGNTINEHGWFSLNTESPKTTLPSGITAFAASAYGPYSIALVGNTLYTSEDKGLNWRKRYFLHAPATLGDEDLARGITMTVDKHNTLWIVAAATGRVWHGKLNCLAWASYAASH